MRHAQLLDLWRRDPVAWAHDVLAEPPYPRQERFLELYAGNRWSSLAACRNWGKSRVLATAALHWVTTRPLSLVFTTAPRWPQVSQTWRHIRGLWDRSKLPGFFPGWEILTHAIKTPYPQWYGIGRTAARVQDLEAEHDGGGGTLVIVDEPKMFPDAFFTSLLGMISKGSVENRLIAGGTPGIPRGWFYRSHGEDRKMWAACRGDAYDVPELRDHAERERERLGDDDPFYRQQQLAEFAMAEGNVVIPLSLIERAVRSDDEIRAAGRGVREHGNFANVVSVDPAGQSEHGDETVMGHRLAGVLVHAEAWQNTREEKTAERVYAYARKAGASAIGVDEPGVGLIVCRVLEQLAGNEKIPSEAPKIVRYKPGVGARASERYQNRKSEDIFLMRDRFREGAIMIPDYPDLIGQLCSWTYTDTRTSKTEVIDPSDSPDWADMLNISFAIEREFDHVRGVRARGI